MRYLGSATKKHGRLIMPDTYEETPDGRTYEVFEIDGTLLLALSPGDVRRIKRLNTIALKSIADHGNSLDELS